MTDKLAKLNETMQSTGYGVELKALTYDRGWPTKSKKPYRLFSDSGAHLASFATLEQAEANWRARAAC